MNEIKTHLIAHTHWDREWYLSFETFRVELVNLIDDLFEKIQKNKNYIFHLDGYTKILEDYLVIKPENKNRLKQYIKSGNIIIGPWYIQADEFLVSGEATVRNLLIGIKDSKEYGKHMPIGYLPDQFGHIAQMPQILKGFDIHSAVFARGIQDGIAEHCWEGLNGDQILGISLTHWYGNCDKLPPTEREQEQYIKNIVEKQKSTLKSNHLLLMNGCDHLYSQDSFIRHDNLENAVKEISKNISLENLPKKTGELRDDNEMFVLASTHSSRVYLKLENHRLENYLEKIIEPLSTFLKIKCGTSYPISFLNYAWRLLLENHAHDSICGCSIDEVHREMEIRNEKVNQVLSQVKDNLLSPSNESKEINIFNLTNYQRIEPFKIIIELPLGKKATDPGTEGSIDSKEQDIELFSNEESVDFEIISDYTLQKMRLSNNDVPLLQAIQRIEVLIEYKLDPYSITKFKIKSRDKSNTNLKDKKIAQSTNFENEFIKLSINLNGSINLIDKTNNAAFNNLHSYVLEGDKGDLYRFISNGKTKILENLNWNINKKEENKLITVFELTSIDFPGAEINTTITCYTHSKRIDFKSIINNSNLDSRLRIHFPTKLSEDFILADTQFGTLKRKRPSGFINGSSVQPLHNFIEHGGLAFFGNGISEYELSENNDGFFVTLIRSIGKLSVVKSHSFIETPEGQCNRRINFSYSIYPSKSISELFKQSCYLSTPILTSQSDLKVNTTSLLNLSNDIQVSSIKLSENHEMIIVRVFNPLNTTVENINLKLKFPFKKAFELNLLESKKYEINKSGTPLTSNEYGIITGEIKPFEIKTIGIEL